MLAVSSAERVLNALKNALFLSCLCYCLPLFAADQWLLWRDQDDIQVYSRPSEKGTLEIRAKTRVDTSLSAFIALLHDTAHLPEWMHSVSEVRVLSEPDQTHDLVHTLFKAPWPIKDRDMVTSSEYRQPSPCSLVLEITDNNAALPEQEGFVRIVDVNTLWMLERQADGTTVIDYQAHANIAGNLPRWIANRLSLQAAFETFEALRRELASERYQQQEVEGISSC
jgi:hypothetical protein